PPWPARSSSALRHHQAHPGSFLSPRCSEVLNARRAKADCLSTRSLPRRNETSPSPRRFVRRRPTESPHPAENGLATGLTLTLRTRGHTSVEEGRPAGDNSTAVCARCHAHGGVSWLSLI